MGEAGGDGDKKQEHGYGGDGEKKNQKQDHEDFGDDDGGKRK